MSIIAARLERLPLSGFHRKLLILGGLGYTFDGMDTSSLAFMLPVLRKLWSLSSPQVGLLASSTYIGYLFGALFAGVVGDLIGRRVVMMSALGLYSAASLASALVNDWHAFLAFRIISGAGAGAESVIIAPFLAEFVAGRYRGAFCGSLAGFFSFGYLASSIIGYFVVAGSPYGWRISAVITALPVLMLLWWRRALPESPRWLESRGRIAEAEAVVSRIEAAVAAEGRTLPPVASAGDAVPLAQGRGGTLLGNLAILWSGPLARVTAVSWLMWFAQAFSYYGFFTWIPTLLVQRGMTITNSFGYSIAIYAAQVPGYFSAAFLNERVGRQKVIAGYMAGGCLSALALALAADSTAIVVAAVCLSLFMNGAFAGIYAYTPEVFPTDIRTTGVGTSSSFGRLGAIGAPILVGFVSPIFGFAGVFAMIVTMLLAGALLVLTFGINTRNRTLEDIAAEELRA